MTDRLSRADLRKLLAEQLEAKLGEYSIAKAEMDRFDLDTFAALTFGRVDGYIDALEWLKEQLK